eukprot:540552-Pyramimonas_sp.AAC.1
MHRTFICTCDLPGAFFTFPLEPRFFIPLAGTRRLRSDLGIGCAQTLECPALAGASSADVDNVCPHV